MNCQSFKAVVQDVDRSGALEETIWQAALTHAEQCIRCARRLHRTREVALGLTALARADQSKQAPLRVELQVLQAFRAEASSKGERTRVAWWLTAAAVMALAFGGGFLWRQMVSPRGGSGTLPAISSSASPEPQPKPTGKAAPSRPAGTSHPLSHRRLRSAPAEPRQPAVLPHQELADFLPLPFADREEPLGAGTVVRIQVAESSLGSLGVPVTEPASAEPVTADVLLGQDGTARAIRFVSGPVPSGLTQQLQSIAF